MKVFSGMAVALAFIGLLGGCNQQPATPDASTQTEPAQPSGPGVLDVLRNSGQLGNFYNLVAAAGMEAQLADAGPYTIVAPWNDALSARERERLMQPENRQELTAFINRHVLRGNHPSTEWTGAASTLTTLGGAPISIISANGKMMVGNATVLQADLNGANGVVHVIDRVLPAG